MPAKTRSISGLGARILPDARRVDLLFEVADLAKDTTGKSSPAGMSIKMEIKPGFRLRPIQEYECRAAAFCKAGWKQLGIAPGAARPVTWEYFVSQGYHR